MSWTAAAFCFTPSLWEPFFVSFWFRDGRRPSTAQHRNWGRRQQPKSGATYQGPSCTCPRAMYLGLPTPAPGPLPVSPESVPSETNPYKQVPPAAKGTNVTNLFANLNVSDIYSLGLLIQQLNNVCMAFRPRKWHSELSSIINWS